MLSVVRVVPSLGGSAVAGAKENTAALVAFWSSTFAAKPINEEFAAALVAERVGPLDCSGICQPLAADCEKRARLASASAPGPDGLPFAAWRATGSLGGASLELVSD